MDSNSELCSRCGYEKELHQPFTLLCPVEPWNANMAGQYWNEQSFSKKKIELPKLDEPLMQKIRETLEVIGEPSRQPAFPGNLLDWFAGLAMQAFMDGSYTRTNEKIADSAYSLAEAMMERRKQRSPKDEPKKA